MVKSRDILRRKSQISDPLSASVEDIFAEIEDNIDNWFKIRLADGKIGWVTVKSVGQI